MLHSICQQTWKTYLWPQDWKRSVFIPIPKKRSAKECSNYHTIALISHTSKVMLKILQGRLQLYVNLQMFKIDLEKLEEPEIKLPTSIGSLKKQVSSRKTSTSALLTMLKLKPLTVQITTNWKIFRDGYTGPPYLPPEESVCRSRSNSQNQTGNNRLVTNRERSLSRLYIVTLLI